MLSGMNSFYKTRIRCAVFYQLLATSAADLPEFGVLVSAECRGAQSSEIAPSRIALRQRDLAQRLVLLA